MESDLLKKQREAREKLTVSEKQISSRNKPAVGAGQINPASSQSSSPQNVSRQDRLAELRKQSQESIKKTQSILEPTAPIPIDEAVPVVEPPTTTNKVESVEPIRKPSVSDIESTSQKNVFKKIETKVTKPERFNRRRRRHDDGRGGRQPKVKKLNRQK